MPAPTPADDTATITTLPIAGAPRPADAVDSTGADQMVLTRHRPHRQVVLVRVFGEVAAQ